MDVQSTKSAEGVRPEPAAKISEPRQRPHRDDEIPGTIECEIWRRLQDRREAALAESLTPEQKLVLPFALCVARLAARRDTRAEPAK